MATQVEVAWAGGLFEGEGCFSLKSHRWAVAQLNMTDEEPVRQFAWIIGVGKVYGPYARKDGWKPKWVWTVTGYESVQQVVVTLWPWLGPRRQSKASEVLTTARLAWESPHQRSTRLIDQAQLMRAAR